MRYSVTLTLPTPPGGRGVQAARARAQVRGARVLVQRGGSLRREERDHAPRHRQEEAVRTYLHTIAPHPTYYSLSTNINYF